MKKPKGEKELENQNQTSFNSEPFQIIKEENQKNKTNSILSVNDNNSESLKSANFNVNTIYKYLVFFLSLFSTFLTLILFYLFFLKKKHDGKKKTISINI